jgi:hypothetical protein
MATRVPVVAAGTESKETREPSRADVVAAGGFLRSGKPSVGGKTSSGDTVE